jgi:hypothetical protein
MQADIWTYVLFPIAFGYLQIHVFYMQGKAVP